MSNWPLTRNIILFFAGLGGVSHELILREGERPTLLLLLAAMMGLPAFLSTDEKRNGKE